MSPKNRLTPALPVLLCCLAMSMVSTPLLAQGSKADDQAFYDTIWWNQPKKIEALGLSDELRAQMDTKLAAFLEVRKQHQQGKTFEDFSAAAEKGDWQAAEEAADAVATAYSEPMRAQMQLIIDVTALMTPEQRQKLLAEFPRMLKRPWVRTARAPMGGKGQDRAGRAPRGQG